MSSEDTLQALLAQTFQVRCVANESLLELIEITAALNINQPSAMNFRLMWLPLDREPTTLRLDREPTTLRLCAVSGHIRYYLGPFVREFVDTESIIIHSAIRGILYKQCCNKSDIVNHLEKIFAHNHFASAMRRAKNIVENLTPSGK